MGIRFWVKPGLVTTVATMCKAHELKIIKGKESHPILRGVKDIWVQAGGYVGKPVDGEILTMAQPLNGMTPDSPADETKPPMPSEWTRTYKAENGNAARVFTSLYGTPEDLLNDGYRRLLVNGCLWAVGLETVIVPDLNIDFVGPFKPNTYGNGSFARGIKPEMYVSYNSQIPANNNTKPKQAKPKKKQAKEKASAASAEIATGKPARYVRIELPGNKRILTLAEVEVFSGGKNVTHGGKATQSSTHSNADAKRAIDGNKSPDWNKGGQTHTKNAGEKNPWWELDLGQSIRDREGCSLESTGF